MKIILDTDIGSNIDDSFALLYLLMKCPADLLGVTVVSSRSQIRAALAKRMIRCFPRSIPVIAGAEKSMSDELIENPLFLTPKDSENGNDEGNDISESLTSSEFYRQMVVKYPGEIDLLAIGPLTNIATFIEQYPHLSENLNSIRILAGKFSRSTAYHRQYESNAANDALAFKSIIDSALCDVFVIGVEISILAGQYGGSLQGISAHSCRKEMQFQMNAFAALKRPVYLHDPVLAASVFSDFVVFEKGQIQIDPANGESEFIADKNFPKRFIAKSIDVPKFWHEFNSVIGNRMQQY